MNRLICVTLIAVMAGCVGIHDAMTPSVAVIKDDFDGKIIIRQPPVNAATLSSRNVHTLGFEWIQTFPDSVFITVGIAFQTRAITNVAFNADGVIIDRITPASVGTEFERSASYRRFEMPLLDFVTIAAAKIVRMRVGGLNDHSVSTFGPDAGETTVSLKFRPFLEQVEAVRSGKKI